MWTRELFGTDVYHLIGAFIIYSMLGWLVESIYMSFCNKKLTNRGFAKSPFCPIYGVGAVCCYLILSPLAHNLVGVYFIGAALATIFEFIVGMGMIKAFGELWWDYNEKPFNYRGIICLESTIAWGFYAVGIVAFLHERVYHVIDKIDYRMGIRAIYIILSIVCIDYIFQLAKALNIDLKEQKNKLVDKVQSFKARWY
ncbi:MAG: putative ABC transporter permease [Lachnospiraceae bacterium]|nr:putative ABC transporter permease [Lachnospiraceae bacterium]